MQALLKIGVFSKMSNTSIKTLRYYDEINVLKPEFIDSENSYRYYSSTQILSIYKINHLKQLGFNLSEIKNLIDNGINKSIIDEKITYLENEIKKIEKMVDTLKNLEDLDTSTINDVQLIDIPSINVASKKIVVNSYHDLLVEYPKCGEPFINGKYLRSSPELSCTIYHDNQYMSENITAEICEGVDKLYEHTNEFVFKRLPKVTAACIYHTGSYEDFPKSYSKLISWIEDNNYEIDGFVREIYIDGIWNKPNIFEWLSQIQIPVKKR